MAWAHGAFHHFGNRTKLEHACVGLGINLLDARREGNVRLARLEEPAVRFECPRITFQVLRVIELCRVEEDADYGNVVLLHTSANERSVPFVQSAHGRHKSDGASFTAMLRQTLAKLFNAVYYLHGIEIKRCKDTN